LRMKRGEKVRISTNSGKNYFGEIEELSETMVLVAIVEECADGTELANKIYLFQGLPKSDKMELIIQKAVELGAYEIIPVAMKNCVVKLDEKKAGSKVARWQEIAKSAAKQSKRSLIPTVHMPMSYKEAVEEAATLDVVLVPYENERGMAATKEAIAAITSGQSIGIFIGPEGGFADDEIALAREKQMQLISLGKRILRTETAGLATLSILMYHLEANEE
ncbi:MAG: 16S rRNA (uracil(1498)-N(3))-methyltransferase, partial [Clostridiales bacterium]|nr:16S rRNA (uracil(1498)-N(3))-methyltransferase [Clostridiales bacterium]MDY4111497.1 16S rRNA (uracil(1498)-N(3))-methyltransferase [Roseburia sp.]